MSCVVALIDGKRRFMGSDSITIYGTTVVPVDGKKVFRYPHDVTIGFVGDVRLIDLISRGLKIPDPSKYKNTEDFLSAGLIPRVAKIAEADDRTDDNDWSAVIIHGQEIWTLDSYLALSKTTTNYFAIGQGQEVAFGYLYERDPGDDPVGLVRGALEATEKFCVGVRGPMEIIELPQPKRKTSGR